jgi:hypothetical protein
MHRRRAAFGANPSQLQLTKHPCSRVSMPIKPHRRGLAISDTMNDLVAQSAFKLVMVLACATAAAVLATRALSQSVKGLSRQVSGPVCANPFVIATLGFLAAVRYGSSVRLALLASIREPSA